MIFYILYTKALLIFCFVEIIGRQLITIVHIRVSLSLSFTVTNMLNFIYKKEVLLEDFIKFNDFQNNPFVVKKCKSFKIEHLRIIIQLIKVKNIKSLKIKSKYFEETNEIRIPFYLYTNKVQENIDLFINKLLDDSNKSIQLVTKWMMILVRIFVKYFK